MRGHGDVTVGPNVRIAVFRAYYTDVNARLQAQAIGLGSEITYLSAEEGAKADQVNFAVLDRVWNLWKQKVQIGTGEVAAPTPSARNIRSHINPPLRLTP